MDLLGAGLDFFLHLDRYLAEVIAQYGLWTYGLLILIVFLETGVVVTPFLPGDSLLFAAGTFAALGSLDPWILFWSLAAAAIAGDTLNYWVGRTIGPKAFSGKIRWLRQDYLRRTEEFYAQHGGKTILLARFVPIIRTFAPFVAGVGQMAYPRFLGYNVGGGTLWVGLFVFGGYFFGTIPVVQANFSVVVLGIIVVSVLPILYEVVRGWQKARAG
ncbi:MAG: DedA family protein [Gemmatimonadota bacterium]